LEIELGKILFTVNSSDENNARAALVPVLDDLPMPYGGKNAGDAGNQTTLASLVVPALNGLRSQARASRCVNNLRLIGAGIHAFAAEHNGMVVPYRGEPSSPESTQSRLWTEYLLPYCAPEIIRDGKSQTITVRVGRRPHDK
jgi:hypothetical protein